MKINESGPFSNKFIYNQISLIITIFLFNFTFRDNHRQNHRKLIESNHPILVKILVVDDHLVVREGLKLIFETEENYEVIGEAENGDAHLTNIYSKLKVESRSEVVAKALERGIIHIDK